MVSRAPIICLLSIGLLAAGCDRKSPPAGQAAEASNTAGVPAPDEVTAAPTAPTDKLDRSHKGEAAPTLAFTGPDGKPVTLAAFRGKPLLMNLWATWCAPCVAEMPTLDAAAGALAPKVQVIVVAQDDPTKVAPFFAAKHFATLKPYVDRNLGLSLAYKANLPTTILYDSAGKEVWRMTGGNAWNTPEATKLIGEAS